MICNKVPKDLTKITNMKNLGTRTTNIFCTYDSRGQKTFMPCKKTALAKKTKKKFSDLCKLTFRGLVKNSSPWAGEEFQPMGWNLLQ